MQFLEFIEQCAAKRPCRQSQHCPHARQHGGVASVGLGQLAGRFREAARLARIDLDQWQSGLGEAALKPAMVSSGRLVDDPSDPGADPAHQRLVALDCVVEAAALAAWEAIGVQRLFRDVDANGNVCHLLPCLCLSCAAQTARIRSGLREKTRVIKL